MSVKSGKQTIKDAEYSEDSDESETIIDSVDSVEELPPAKTDKASIKSNSSRSSRNSKPPKIIDEDTEDDESESDKPSKKSKKLIESDDETNDETNNETNDDETNDEEENNKKNSKKDNKKDDKKDDKNKVEKKDKIKPNEWNEIKEQIKVPNKKQFYSSPVMNAIKWMVDNLHKEVGEKGLIKRNPKDKSETVVKNISSKDFDKEFGNEYYKAFVKSYVIKAALRKILSKHEDARISIDNKTKTLKIADKKDTFINLVNYSEDINDIEEFNKLTKDIYYNINKNKLTINKIEAKDSKKVDDYKLLLEFLELENNEGINAYNIAKSKNYKHLVDFVEFDFIYYDSEHDISKVINEEEFIESYAEKEENKIITKKYRQLFDENILKQPFNVFDNRIAILKNNDFIDENRYEELIKDVSEKCEESKNENIQRLGTIMTKQTYINIVDKCYIPNKFMLRVFTKLFNSSMFIEALTKEFASIAFIFGPYYCDIPGIHAPDNVKKFEDIKEENNNKKKQKILYKNFRKKIFSEITYISESLDKENGIWTALIETDIENNFWLSSDAKFVKSSTKQQPQKKITKKETEKKQTKKPIKKVENSDNDEDDTEDSEEVKPKKQTKQQQKKQTKKETEKKQQKKPIKKVEDSDNDEDDTEDSEEVKPKKQTKQQQKKVFKKIESSSDEDSE